MTEEGGLGWFSAHGRLMILPTSAKTLELMEQHKWLRPASPLELVTYQMYKAESAPFLRRVLNRLQDEALNA